MFTTQIQRLIASLTVGMVLAAGTARAYDDAQGPSAKEKELIGVLQSDAAPAEKAITCKKLAIEGSSASVPELAKLLPHPQLSSWARIALEAIPGEESNAALRTATSSLEGELLVGVINSIGVRRDEAAVATLTARLQQEDTEVASAAAVALGHIGNAAATKTLRDALSNDSPKVRSAVAEGCVLCAERLQAEGKTADAVALYDEVRQAEVPQQRVLEATRGAILARSQEEGVPMLVELLRSSDKKLFQLALGTVREYPGDGIDKALTSELAKAPPARGALIVVAMSDRPDTVDLPALLKASEEGQKPVRLAVLQALGRVGDASCLSVLLDAAVDEDADLAQAAKDSLAGLAGEKVDAQIAAQLEDAKGKTYALLIDLVGQRRIPAEPALLKALETEDGAVRAAALRALGETITLKRLSVLISQVVSPRYPKDADAAQRALMAASVRMEDRDACAALLARPLGSSPPAAKEALMETLAAVGGDQSLRTLATAAKSSDLAMQDIGSRLLGKWNSIDAAPVLLDLAKNAPEARYRIRSLRGYVGLARKFTMPEKERVAMCQSAVAVATRDDEKKLVLDVLKLRPSAEGLRLAVKLSQEQGLKEAGTEAALTIAQKVGGKQAGLKEILANAGLARVDLEIVKAEYGAGSTFKDVTTVLRKHAGDSPLVVLPSPTYNASFGGDPLPGTTKQLRVQYRYNGREGRASFAENALIILPAPK